MNGRSKSGAAVSLSLDLGNGILCRDSLCDNPLPGTAPDSGLLFTVR